MGNVWRYIKRPLLLGRNGLRGMRTKVNGTCVDDKHRRITNRTSLSGYGIDSGYGLNGKISVTGSFDNSGTVFGMVGLMENWVWGHQFCRQRRKARLAKTAFLVRSRPPMHTFVVYRTFLTVPAQWKYFCESPPLFIAVLIPRCICQTKTNVWKFWYLRYSFWYGWFDEKLSLRTSIWSANVERRQWQSGRLSTKTLKCELPNDPFGM